MSGKKYQDSSQIFRPNEALKTLIPQKACSKRHSLIKSRHRCTSPTTQNAPFLQHRYSARIKTYQVRQNKAAYNPKTYDYICMKHEKCTYIGIVSVCVLQVSEVTRALNHQCVANYGGNHSATGKCNLLTTALADYCTQTNTK